MHIQDISYFDYAMPTVEPALVTFLGQVLTAIAKQLDALFVNLWFYDKTQDKLSLYMTCNEGQIQSVAPSYDTVLVSTPSFEVPLWRELDNTRRPLVIYDVANDPRLQNREILLAQGVRTLMLVPLLLSDEPIGWMSIYCTKGYCYNLEQLELAQVSSQQIILAVQLSRLAEQGRQSAVLEERNRMAREIHDTLAQSFVGIVVQLEAAEEILRCAPGEARAHLTRARNLAREGLVGARRSVWALRPQVLERGNLPSALTHLVEQLNGGTQVQVQFNVFGMPRALPADVEDNLLRVSQEALTNALKHAQASEIQVELTFGSQEVRLRVWDNGRGFDPQVIAPGFGLIGMRERAKCVEGELTINAQVGQGTEVICAIHNQYG